MQEIFHCSRCSYYLRPLHPASIQVTCVRRSIKILLGGLQPHKAKSGDAHGCVYHTIDHRHNVGSVVFMCTLSQGKCSSEIKEIYPSIKSFNMTTRLSQFSHPFVLELLAYRIAHYRDSSFFNRTTHFWNQQWPFPRCLMSPFSSRMFTNITPPVHSSIPITLPDQHRARNYRGYPLRGGL